MPWTHTDPMCERTKFVLAYHDGAFSMTELCQRFGISRKTGYKWIRRFDEAQFEGLHDRSRARLAIAHRTPEHLEQIFVVLRQKHPFWGARKLLAVVERRHPELSLPAASTVTEILKRHGLITPRPKRRRAVHPGARPLVAEAPNDVWCADFKGEFLLGNRRYCYPLTVSDAHSRYLLACQALPSTHCKGARSLFKRLFQEYGLPRAIRTDNGVPFASPALAGISRLSLYWMKLGIRADRIEPASPHQNGRHERMHRTLKAETTRPPENSFPEQQQRFETFRSQYNEQRPHEALQMQVPAYYYHASARALPRRLPEPEYAAHMEVRRVSAGGAIKFKSWPVFLSMVLASEQVGLEEIDEGLWNIYFGEVLLARYDERERRVRP